MYKSKDWRRTRNLSRLNVNKIGRVTSNKMKSKDQEDPGGCQKAGHNQEKVGSQAGFWEVLATQRILTRRENTRTSSVQLLLHTKIQNIFFNKISWNVWKGLLSMLLGCAYVACCVQRSRVPSVCTQAVSHSYDADFFSLRPSMGLSTRFPNIFPQGRQLCFNEHAQKEGSGKGEFFGLSLSGGIKSGYLNTWNTDARSGRKCSLSKNAARSPCPASKEEPIPMAEAPCEQETHGWLRWWLTEVSLDPIASMLKLLIFSGLVPPSGQLWLQTESVENRAYRLVVLSVCPQLNYWKRQADFPKYHRHVWFLSFSREGFFPLWTIRTRLIQIQQRNFLSICFVVILPFYKLA